MMTDLEKFLQTRHFIDSRCFQDSCKNHIVGINLARKFFLQKSSNRHISSKLCISSHLRHSVQYYSRSSLQSQNLINCKLLHGASVSKKQNDEVEKNPDF